MYALRNIRVLRVPLAGLFMPALFNGLLVGFELDFFVMNNMSFDATDFLIQAGCVALGEVAVLFILGLPLYLALKNRKLSGVLISDKDDK